MIFRVDYARRLAIALLAALILFLVLGAIFEVASAGGRVVFTPPRTGMVSSSCCVVDSVPLRSCYSTTLFVFGQQSPTWVAKHVAMLANRDTFARYWPIVAFEADPRQTSSKAVCPPWSTRDSLPYPDSLRGRAGYVVARNSTGGFCWSNVVSLP